MNGAQFLRGCDLHLHILGAFYTEDIFELGRDHYKEINWEGYLNRFERAFGFRPNPIQAFNRAISEPNGLAYIKQLHVFTEEDGGDFNRWEAKFRFFMSIWTYYRGMGEEGNLKLLRKMVGHHKTQGLDYVEYRIGSGLEGFKYWHKLCAETLRKWSTASFTARYILSFPRDAEAYEHYDKVQQLFNESPELVETIVGIDFAGEEEGKPPKKLATFVDQVLLDNKRRPERALDIVYHVGESFFDKSLESAVRWCHEVAEMGVRRIGHAIALGLDPAVAVSRRKQAHEHETVSERLDQIEYDLRYADALKAYSVAVDREALRSEAETLNRMPLDEMVTRTYDVDRLEEIRHRQNFVLDRLSALGTVIECCPTSNLRIGGVPKPENHPIIRFLKSNVDVVICTDDPGNFDITVSSEIDWLLKTLSITEIELQKRLGNSRRHRLAAERTPFHYPI